MATFAAVDIGANSVRLKIARLVRGRPRTIYEDREVTRLGASVFVSRLLDPEAMARAVKVLERFRKATQAHSADRVRVVATSALRDARNRQVFVDWVRAATGWTVEVISGLEEGRLIHLGLIAQGRLGKQPALLVDLGGGSCELTVSAGGHIRDMYSLPLGAVRLTGKFLRHDPPKKKEVTRMREVIARESDRVAAQIRTAAPQVVIATGGTAAALAAAAGAGTAVSRAQVARLAARLQKMKIEQRKSIRGIGPRRAEIIMAGAAVFDELMHVCELRGFRYSELGLRDGMLAQMAAEFDVAAPAHKRVQAQRDDALLALCKRYGADLKHARQVRALVEQLFPALRPAHQLPPEYLEYLRAAAMLYEIGGYVSRSARQRHAYYLIAHSEIFGYAPRQRRLIGILARYAAGAPPERGSKVMAKVRQSDFDQLRKAIALLRLARALDQGRRGAVQRVSLRLSEGEARLRLSARRDGELETWAAQRQGGFFHEVFGLELAVS